MDSYDDYYDYRPLPTWQGVLCYYGTLVAKEEWRHLIPLFDFVKQLSTSCYSVSFQPTIVDDKLYLARGPLESNPVESARLSIEMNNPQEVLFRRYEAGSTDGLTQVCHRVEALHHLNGLLREL